MNIGKVIRAVVIIGCFIGVFAYMASESHKRDLNRQAEELQRIESSKKIDEINEKKKQEEKLQQELKDNADNAEYQVNKWHDTYFELKKQRAVSFNLTTVQVSRLKKDLKEAKEQLLYWIDKRTQELTEKRANAEAEGNTAAVDQYNRELEKVKSKADIIEEGDEDFD